MMMRLMAKVDDESEDETRDPSSLVGVALTSLLLPRQGKRAHPT